MTNQTMQAEVAAALRCCTATVQEAGFGVWRVGLPTLATATPFAQSVTVRMEADWLLFDALLGDIKCPPDERREVLWRLLRANGEVAGGAKFAMVPGGCPSVRLRAELPLDQIDQDAHGSNRIESVWAGISAGWALWHGTREPVIGGNGGNGGVAESRGGTDDGATLESIRDGCRASGWTLHERPDGRLLVDLEIPERYLQAEVSGAVDGGVLVRAELVAAETATPPHRATALAILLLQVSAVVRLARPTVGGLEVVLPAAPAPGALVGALSALSVAAQMAEREARLLVDDDVLARAYLTACGMDDQVWCDAGGERAVMFNRAGGETGTPPAP